MTTQPGPSYHPKPSTTAVDELFADTAPIGSADDLAQAGVFDDAELDEFLADLRQMRETDLA